MKSLQKVTFGESSGNFMFFLKRFPIFSKMQKKKKKKNRRKRKKGYVVKTKTKNKK